MFNLKLASTWNYLVASKSAFVLMANDRFKIQLCLFAHFLDYLFLDDCEYLHMYV